MRANGWLAGWLLATLAGCGSSLPGMPRDSASVAPAAVETGTHWANPSEFAALRKLGYEFVVVTLDPARPAGWRQTFDAAQTAGLKLVAGLQPAPFKLRGAEWTLGPEAEAFLRYAASRAPLVKAIFVYNEPYWVNPFTGANDTCGALSAAQLRALRSRLRSVWPEAKIYHDIGGPAEWAPGGSLPSSYPCIGNKYADQTTVADYVGIWAYPFDTDGYHKSRALAVLRRQISYVRSGMRAEPVLLGQSFQCTRCGGGGGTRWPTPNEMREWNCSLRSLGAGIISWYPWRQALYDDYLARHPEMWSLTGPASCQAPASVTDSSHSP